MVPLLILPKILTPHFGGENVESWLWNLTYLDSDSSPTLLCVIGKTRFF